MRKPKSSIYAAADVPSRRKGGKPPEPEISEDTLSAEEQLLVTRVRRSYMEERSRWESFKIAHTVDYEPPAVYNGRGPLLVDGELAVDAARVNVWLTLGRWLTERGIHPETYIQIQFDCLTHQDRVAPEPAQLRNSKYLERWHLYSPRLGERIRVSLIVQKSKAEGAYALHRSNGTKAGDAWAMALTDTTLQLTPLFCFCVAVRLNSKRFYRLADRYVEDAVLQFERHRDHYLRYWSGIIPPGFAEYARRTYPLLLNG